MENIQNINIDTQCVIMLPSGQIAVGCEDAIIRIITIYPREEIKLEGHEDVISSLALIDGALVSASWDGTLRIWDLSNYTIRSILRGHLTQVSCMISFQEMIASGDVDGEVRIWNNKGDCEAIFTTHSTIFSLAFLKDRRLAIGNEVGDVYIYIWDYIKDKYVTLIGHQNTVTVIQCTFDKIITASWDGTLKIWNLKHNSLERTLDDINGGILSLKLLGDTIISESSDIYVWNLRGDILRVLENTNMIYKILILPDNRIAVGYSDGSIRIWNSVADIPDLILKSHEEAIIDILLTKEGWLISCDSSGSIKMWQ